MMMNASKQLRWVGTVCAAALCGLACSSSDNGGPPRMVGLPAQGAGNPAVVMPAPGATATGGTGSAAPAASSTGGAAAAPTPGVGGTGGMPAAAAGTGGMGAAGMGAAGATGPLTMTGGMGDPSACPAAPAGAPAPAVAALAAINAVRIPAGSGCDNMSLALDMSALNHCNYYAANSANKMCIADPHAEVMSCTGYTGTNLGLRMMAAGYNARGGYSEVMAFVNNPASSVAQWIGTVWHRIPILDPWTTDMGYGNATGCDTIDFGTGTTGAPATTVVVYPYAGQTGLPTSFDGSHEGPMPPAPSTGWPSSSPINVYAQGMTITSHVLTQDGSTTPIDHVWLDSTSTNVDAGVKSFLRNTAFMYANKPFTANTKYHVTITGMHTGGALNLDWTFTTGAASRFGP